MMEGVEGRLDFLVVDDNEIERHLYETILSFYFEGCRIEHAANGAEALTKCEARDYSAIIADIEMPVMCGIEFYDRLKEEDPRLAGRLLFVSANTERHKERLLCEKRGRYLQKPYRREELIEMSRKLIESEKPTNESEGTSTCRRRLPRAEVRRPCILKIVDTTGQGKGALFVQTVDHSNDGMAVICKGGEELDLPAGRRCRIFAESLGIFGKEGEIVWSAAAREGLRAGLRWL